MTDLQFADTLERRDYAAPLELVQLEGRPNQYSTLHGRAVPYETFAPITSKIRERHARNSFKRSTDRDPAVPLLLWHDAQRFPIGVATAWEHRDDGLYGTWRLNDSEDAQRAAKAAADGEMRGLSVGFMRIEPEWNAEGTEVTHRNSRLVEVSMTPVAAFADAQVISVRTALRPPIRRREVEAWREVVERLR